MKQRNHNKLFALVTAVMMLVGICSGCGEKAAVGSINLNYGISSAWDSLMPYHSMSRSNYARIVYDKIYDKLAYIEADGTCLPRAAKSWESTDDGYGIVFHLDEKAKFHDGTAVTAENWVDSIKLATNGSFDTLGRNIFSCLKGTDANGVAESDLGVEAVDAMTLKLTMKEKTSPEDFLVDKNREFYVLPTHLFKDTAVTDILALPLWNAPVGSGPCVFDSEIVGSTLVLKANKAYQLGAAGFDTLTMTVMDKSNLLTALIAGDLDYFAFGGNISEEDADIAKNAGISVSQGTVPNTFYELMINNETIPQKEIRQAINLSLDKELLCRQNTKTLGRVTNTSILPSDANDEKAMVRDVEKAKGLLLGYDGRSYKLACTAPRAGLAALIQQNLQEAGIVVEIETVDSATLFSGMYDGKYDLALASHTPGVLPLWFTESRFNEDGNLFRVGDLSGYITRIDAVRAESDPANKDKAVAELERYLQEELPFIPLWFSCALHAESKTVKGIDYPASSFSN
ncbi:MAG: ABC transporter substrate-binding protein, partial [Evtepia sp.]